MLFLEVADLMGQNCDQLRDGVILNQRIKQHCVDNNDKILDIGSVTAAHYMDHIHRAGTVIWNGPVGVFEYDQFGTGTKALANAIAESEAFSLAGGGDTIAAINKYGVADRISYISTGGGAFLEFLEGKSLPGVSILEYRTKQSRLMH